MLDKLYEDIGDQIKRWAKSIFVIELICAIIAVIILLANKLIVEGLIVLICAPIVVCLSTCVLYAFGQLVDDIYVLRNKSCPPEEDKEKTNTYHTSKNIHCDFCLRKTDNIKTYKKADKDGEILEFCLCEECAKNNGYL